VAYFAVRKERIAGQQYVPGDRVPAAVLNKLKPSVLNAMLQLGRLKFEDDGPRPTSRKKRSKKNGN
jgi:hypothetical protein